MYRVRNVRAVAGLLIFGVLLVAFSAQAYAQTDPLPSWNDGEAKQAIVTFVMGTTDQASPKIRSTIRTDRGVRQR
jgi:hypothetical protein